MHAPIARTLGLVANLFQQVAYPRFSKMCPVIIRARGVLLIKDAARLKEEYEQQSEVSEQFVFDGVLTAYAIAIPNKGWFSAATDLIGALDAHVKETLVLMDHVQGYQRGPEAICLRSGAITCLVTVAELYDRIFDSKQDNQYSKACMNTLEGISAITLGLQENEYYLLDPYIAVSRKPTMGQLRLCVLNQTLKPS